MQTAPARLPRRARSPIDWRLLLGLYFVTSLVEAVGVSQIYAFLPNRLAEVGLSEAEIGRFVGLLGSLFFVSGLPFIPLWGVWADKYSRKAVIIRSALVEAVVFAGVALSQAPWQLVASMALVGFQLGNTGVMLAAIRDVTPRRRLGLAMGVFGASSPLGFGLGPAAGSIMIDHLHLTSASVFASSAVLSVAVAVMLAVGSREVRPEIVPSGSTLRLAFGAVRGVLADGRVRWLFALFGLVFVGRQMGSSYLALLVHAVEHTPLREAGSVGLVLGAAPIVGALLSPIGGWFADRAGFRAVLVVSIAGLTAAVAAMPFSPAVAWLAAGSCLIAAFQAAIVATVSALLATEVPAERRSATLNLIYLPLYFGGIVGPAVGAIAYSGGLQGVFLAAAAVLAGATVLAALFARTKPAALPAAGAVGGATPADQAGTFISAGPT